MGKQIKSASKMELRNEAYLPLARLPAKRSSCDVGMHTALVAAPDHAAQADLGCLCTGTGNFQDAVAGISGSGERCASMDCATRRQMMKPETADKIREREIRLIHVAKRVLGMEDDTYRAMLFAVARVRSAAELDFTRRKKVLDHMQACGFKVTTAAPANTHAAGRYWKFRALLSQLHMMRAVEKDSDQAVRAYIKRTTGKDDFQFLNQHQVATVIESLKSWIARLEQNRDAVLKQEG